MASFDPGYGETEVSEEEREVLTPFALGLLGEPVLKATLYDIEQTLQPRLRLHGRSRGIVASRA